MLIRIDNPQTAPDKVFAVGQYHPYRNHIASGKTSAEWPVHSKRTLDLKEGYPRGINYFEEQLRATVTHPFFAIAIVPGHGIGPASGGIATLAGMIRARLRCQDGSGYLVRVTAIAKLATGGNRSIQVHRESIEVRHAAEFKGRQVLLLDDIYTTGNSIAVCRALLLEAGAGTVTSLVLSQTI